MSCNITEGGVCDFCENCLEYREEVICKFCRSYLRHDRNFGNCKLHEKQVKADETCTKGVNKYD